MANTDAKERFFPINRWNLTDTIVQFPWGFATAEEAEAHGRNSAATYQDHHFECVFRGTWEAYNQLCHASSERYLNEAPAPRMRRRSNRRTRHA